MSLTNLLVRPRAVFAAAVLGAVLVPIAASAQNPHLAEVARKEQERRRAAKPSGKVLTNKDLPQTTSPAGGAPAPLPEAVPQPREDPATQPESDKDEAAWRTRIGAAREQLRRDQMFAEALQSRINGLTSDFVNRDDPYQRGKIGEDRQKALAELERVKADIAQHTKDIADIEEEARKAGVPPGWLRFARCSGTRWSVRGMLCSRRGISPKRSGSSSRISLRWSSPTCGFRRETGSGCCARRRRSTLTCRSS